jgi:hypothetical protein
MEERKSSSSPDLRTLNQIKIAGFRGKAKTMRYLRYLALLGVSIFAASYASAQVSVGIGVGPVRGYIGAAPVCAYGYYGYAPYACAPYGYYGPSYFHGGLFIGAGPWYHGYGRGYYGGYHGYYGRPVYGRPGFRSAPYARGGYVGRGGFGNSFHGGYHGGRR